jgi:hypothetical protein
MQKPWLTGVQIYQRAGAVAHMLVAAIARAAPGELVPDLASHYELANQERRDDLYAPAPKKKMFFKNYGPRLHFTPA